MALQHVTLSMLWAMFAEWWMSNERVPRYAGIV